MSNSLAHLRICFFPTLSETLRMYPPVGILLRKCTQPYQIPDTNTVIPKGCQMFVPIYAFHHDPEYFPEPEEFRPERFSEENRKNIPQYAYMPFGHGPRVCIGEFCTCDKNLQDLAYMKPRLLFFQVSGWQ